MVDSPGILVYTVTNMGYIALVLTMSKNYTTSPSLGQHDTSPMTIRKAYENFHYRSLCIQRRWYKVIEDR